MADLNVKFFFLVAGFEYSHKSLDFWKMCTGRVRERIATINRTFAQKDALVSKDTTLRFIRFTIGTGKVEVIDRTFIAGRGIKRTIVLESEWQPLSSIGTGDSFDPDTFVSKGPFRQINRVTDYINLNEEYPELNPGVSTRQIMSISDVYRSVRGAPLESVLELSMFSHAWIEGPILVNSSDFLHDPNERGPGDKDGRAALDFNLIMGETDGSPAALLHRLRFMSAFDPKGFMQTWGCNFDIELRVVQQAQTRIKRGGVTDDTLIDFHFEEAKERRRYTITDPTSSFLPSDSSQVDISRKFREVKKFLRRRLGQSYAFLFASTSGRVTALGALPGTSGDPEWTGFNLMKVCAKKDPPECSDGYASVFDFYRKHIGISVDSRGYGIFDQATVQKLAADIAADNAPHMP